MHEFHQRMYARKTWMIIIHKLLKINKRRFVSTGRRNSIGKLAKALFFDNRVSQSTSGRKKKKSILTTSNIIAFGLENSPNWEEFYKKKKQFSEFLELNLRKLVLFLFLENWCWLVICKNTIKALNYFLRRTIFWVFGLNLSNLFFFLVLANKCWACHLGKQQ